MAPGSSVVDVTYDDPRTGQRIRERRIQEIPDYEIDNVRRRERDMVLAPWRPPDQQLQRYDSRYEDDANYDANDRNRRPNGFLGVDDGPRRARSYRNASSRRRSPSADSSSSVSSSDRRRRHRKGHRRARSARAAVEDRAQNSDDEGLLWYSGKPRKDGNILERHLDSSYDGLIAAAAGAAIGSMTARRFAQKEGDHEKGKNWKTIAGGVAGAFAFNVAENHYRVYTEERQERKEEEKEEKEDKGERGRRS